MFTSPLRLLQSSVLLVLSSTLLCTGAPVDTQTLVRRAGKEYTVGNHKVVVGAQMFSLAHSAQKNQIFDVATVDGKPVNMVLKVFTTMVYPDVEVYMLGAVQQLVAASPKPAGKPTVAPLVLMKKASGTRLDELFNGPPYNGVPTNPQWQTRWPILRRNIADKAESIRVQTGYYQVT